MIHESHWERLASLAPDDVCRRSSAWYDAGSGVYTLPLLDRCVLIDPGGRAVRWREDSPLVSQGPGYDVALVAVVYLVEARQINPAGEWVTAESLRSGAFFFRGPHAIPTAEVAGRFGEDRDTFLIAGEKLGGVSADWGDACVQLQALPRVAVRLVLWLGDDEFPGRATMLFDSLVDEHLPLDVLHTMARYVTSSLVRAAGDGP